MPIINTQKILTPYGRLLLGSYEQKLCFCTWISDNTLDTINKSIKKNFMAKYKEQSSLTTIKATNQLMEYFEGKRQTFDIPLLQIGTLFQKKAWECLLKIEYGTTINYQQQAFNMNVPTSIRATANANKANPLVIFIPCHRVIGSNGNLTGYSGGLVVKKKLLFLETTQH